MKLTERGNSDGNLLGGAPYTDLVKGFDYVLKTYPFLDKDRAVALGASYGGYMVNWIQGQDFGRKFKALVGYTTAEIFPEYANLIMYRLLMMECFRP